jgi:F-type H+-transporting ATPase subunit b
MDAILQQLGQLLLQAVPTFLLVILLNVYLKQMFFKPLEKVLRQRYEATEGARKAAEDSLARASAKTAEYEAALRAARSEMYQAQDTMRKEMQEKEAAQTVEARHAAEAQVKAAKAELAADVQAAKASLARESEALANQIAESILRRSAA